MSGQRIGYIRVSSIGQNTERQLDGLELDRVFEDKVSAKDIDRPALRNMLGFIREGDTVIIHSMDRLARNLDDLRKLVKELTAQGIKVQFIKESLIFSGEDSPMATLLLSVMGAFAEFERALLRERQREGIELAKKRGAYRGRQRMVTDEQIETIRSRVAAGVPKAKVARDLGINRDTVYKYLSKDNY